MARPSGQKTMKPTTIRAMVAGVHAGRIRAVLVICVAFLVFSQPQWLRRKNMGTQKRRFKKFGQSRDQQNVVLVRLEMMGQGNCGLPNKTPVPAKMTLESYCEIRAIRASTAETIIDRSCGR